MKALVFLIILFYSSKAQASGPLIFPSFHPDPESISDTLFRTIKREFEEFKEGAIIDGREDDNESCERITKHGISLWQCYKERTIYKNDIFSHHEHQMTLSLWGEMRTFHIKNYLEDSPLSEEDIRSFKFIKNLTSHLQIILKERELVINYSFNEKGFQYQYYNRLLNFRLLFEQRNNEDQTAEQYLEAICAPCSLKGFRVTAIPKTSGLYQYFYERQNVPDLATPQGFLSYVNSGLIRPFEREAERINLHFHTF